MLSASIFTDLPVTRRIHPAVSGGPAMTVATAEGRAVAGSVVVVGRAEPQGLYFCSTVRDRLSSALAFTVGPIPPVDIFL
jgi:hypothetical protein